MASSKITVQLEGTKVWGYRRGSEKHYVSAERVPPMFQTKTVSLK